VETRHINLNLLLQDVDRLLRRLLGEDIELVIQTGPGLGLVNADAGQLEQVMVNLVVNARDAMPNGGRLVIETQNVELDDTFAFDHSGVSPGPYVMLAITDTGTGMPEEVKQHIFEPFFTTKEPGAGTGLGLATCYGIISQSKGSIWVYSEVGLGTTFKVYLPRIEGIADDLPQRVEPFGFARGSERVLVVEDAPTVRALAVRVLRDQGYQVVEAQDGAEALRVLYATATPFDLLLTDVVMPKMGGKALADQVRTRYPHTKILFTSGYTDEAMGRNGQLDEARAFLQKPFTPAALTQKVRDMLDG
jgi:CheY-like chemotaxis protein